MKNIDLPKVLAVYPTADKREVRVEITAPRETVIGEIINGNENFRFEVGDTANILGRGVAKVQYVDIPILTLRSVDMGRFDVQAGDYCIAISPTRRPV